MEYGARRLLLAVSLSSIAAIMGLFLASAPAAAETRLCATTTVAEAFVMPGGSEHPPGRLTLCRRMKYSPSRAIHVGYVDRAPVGMLLSERGLSEAPTETEPYMMFARDHKGRLHLYGFAVPCGEGMETFRFERFPVNRARGSAPVMVHAREAVGSV